MADDKTVKPCPRSGFVPLTGNPEAGDYYDWVRHLKPDAEVVRSEQRPEAQKHDE